MSLRALVTDFPERTLALVSDTHVLLLRHNTQSTSKCIADFTTVSEFDAKSFQPLRPGGVHGTLGLISIQDEIFLCLVTAASDRAELRPGEVVKRILDVEFYGLTRADFDQEIHRDPYQEDPDDAYIGPYDYTTGQDRRDGIVHPCQALKKLLSDGSFYYSLTFDLTNPLQRRAAAESRFDIDSLDRGYLWNSYMIDPLIDFRSRLAAPERRALDASQIITTAIRGYVESYSISASRSPLRNLSSSQPSRLLLISRLSCKRAGTRFNARGIDDDGNVANFVETETAFWHPSGTCFSYVQVRGSVPVFWEQTAGLVPQQQRIQITRSKEATQPAFDKHVDELEHKYGAVQVLNLLAERRTGEDTLTQLFNEHIRVRRTTRGDNLLTALHYDFHLETSGADGYMAANAIRSELHDRAESMAYFLADQVQDGQVAVVLQQQGVFRTNCLDCLDRTNLVQTILSEMGFQIFLEHRAERSSADIISAHSSLWANNGDALSKIYAGTGALKSSFTRHGKMSLAGAIADARKSVKRLYVNNFQDGARQNVIDTLLGRLVSQAPVYLYDPINEFVKSELEQRLPLYTRSGQITLWAGTFNLNGRPPSSSNNLSSWLWPKEDATQGEPDIFVVSFQEIVELSPQQIMSTDPVYLRDWERKIADELNASRRDEGEEYIQLRSGQLVGAALIIYVKSRLLPFIKNVEGTSKKTGMSGIAGNKGAVAIRMDVWSTRLCFVTSHLAAGHSNVEDRNRDYRTIADGLRFPRKRGIDDHDAVIWLGDFNYRINGENSQVRKLIQAKDLDTLYRFDQLNVAMSEASAFPYYSEGPIHFDPTYKYDNGTDDYDSSEKQRVPAWCDRVLFKGKGLRQSCYRTSPLRFSDHRPVYARFSCSVTVVDEVQKGRIMKELYTARRQALDGSHGEHDLLADQLDDAGWSTLEAAPRLGGLSSLEAGFEPIAKRKWWLRDGLPARSDVAEKHSPLVPNPARPHNPFTPSDEPDWVDLGASSPPPSASTHSSRQLPNSVRSTASVTPSVSSQMPKKPDNNSSRAVNSPPLPARKPAPTVPRKPAALSAVVGQLQQQQQQQQRRHHSLDGADDSSKTNELGGAHLIPKLPLRPGLVKRGTNDNDEQVATDGAGAGSADLLLMLDNEQQQQEGLSRIPSLVPSRQQQQ